MNKQGQSLIETLLQLMPELGKKEMITKGRDYVNSIAAESLFTMWKNTSDNKKTFTRPVTMSKVEVDKMKDEGLVKAIGDKIELTTKGEKVIKVMILGDSKSIYEEDGVSVDYNQALANTKEVKTAKQSKAASSWWDRF
ncbi:MAG: hypothetical protein J7L15_07675 [Clostridiales bacterium]|nr:hypothetical protein [Clostridiales bacterium]